MKTNLLLRTFKAAAHRGPKNRGVASLLAFLVCTTAVSALLVQDQASGQQAQFAGRPEQAAALTPDEISTALRQIRADGIPGSLVLCGEGNPPTEAFTAFLRLAKEKQAKVVLVRIVGRDDDQLPPRGLLESRGLLEEWKRSGGAVLTEIRVVSREAADGSELQQALSHATGVWIEYAGKKPLAEFFTDTKLAASCQELLKRGGVVGGGPDLAAISGSHRLADEKRSELSPGLGWLPDAAIDFASHVVITLRRDGPPQAENSKRPGDGSSRLAIALARQRGCVGYSIGPDTTLVIRGRLIEKLGADKVGIELPATANYAAETIVLEGNRRFADLTALRRYALQRLQDVFPARQPARPLVEKGTLIIVGGGGMPTGLAQKFVDLAGGKEARIVVIPISMPDPLPERDAAAEAFRRLGAKEVTLLRGRSPEEVDKPDSLAALEKATGIWFGGGRQWRFIDAYEGTKAGALMHDVLNRGGVIGGSSAGASIQGEYMARGNPLGPLEIMAPGYERGLAFLPGVAVDQHFTQRKRFGDLASLVNRYPQLLGIGIDETTAIVVQGSEAEVTGRNRVCFYDRSQDDGRDAHHFVSVFPGGKYDLAERRILDGGTPPDGVAPVEDPVGAAK